MSKPIQVINKAIQCCFYSLFFITPLIMASITSELFEFNKMIFIYLVTILIFSLWVTKMILVNKIIIKKTPLDIPILLFLLSQVFSTIFSIDIHTSIFGYYGRFNGGLISIIAYIILFYGLISNHADFQKNFINKLLKLSIVSSLLVMVWGLPGKFGYDLSCLVFTKQLSNSCWTNQFRPAERLFSTLGQPNWLGAYLAINFFIGLYFFVTKEEKKYTILNAAYLILNFTTILFTRSRSALLAAISGLIIIFGFFFYKRILVFKNYRLFFLLLIVSLLIFKTGVNKIDNIIDPKTYFKPKVKTVDKATKTPTEIDVTESGDIRKIVWKGALNLGKRYPFFGSGVETFAYGYYFVRPAEHNLTSEWDYLYNKAHNEYLNYFATTGYIGLITYLFLIVMVITYTAKNLKNQILNNKKISNQTILTITLLILYLTILITNFFGFSTSTINLYFYLIPAIIIIINSNVNNEIMKQLDHNRFSRSQKLYFFILLSSTLYFLFSIVSYWLADISYAKGDNLYKVGQYQESANLLNQAIKWKYEHVYEDKLSYVLANLAFISGYQKEKEIAQQLTELSKYYNKKSIKASPKNVLYWKTSAKNEYLFYQNDGDINNLYVAIESLNQAKKLSPTDPKISYSLALFYSLLVDEKNIKNKKELQQLSILEINRSITLKSNDASFYLLKGQLLKKFGRLEEAKKTFQYILDKLNPEDTEAKKELQGL